MRVFVAGASGAIGRPLVRQLVAAGHNVTGTTRRQERAEEIRAAGAKAVVCDVLDRPALDAAVKEAAPEVVVNQLTSLPQDFNPKKIDYGPTNRVREEGGDNLMQAALAVGARRYVTQSIAFIYAPEGDWVKDEEARPFEDAPPPFDEGEKAMLAHERQVLGTEGIEGLVLRYGQFYGPGTYYTPGSGSIARQVEKRMLPLIGPGTGMASFIHVEDAAGATVAALDRGAPGIYNVTDDEPAPVTEWLPIYAEALGAKPPRRVPIWIARLVGGRMAVEFGVNLRGASNAKAKRELGWQPSYPSWRQGFREALDA
ncbi:MAG TPA: NAD(P)-dependent oxidoreductase [Solirubrobacterales bacterium]|nr:NAD(P)-dependent oxidoreductase [Solirubrobacterales bacterium]